MKSRSIVTAARAALLGGAFGGGSGGVVGGGIAQFFFGAETHLLPLWVAAFTGALVGGVFSALVTRDSLRKASSSNNSGSQSSQ